MLTPSARRWVRTGEAALPALVTCALPDCLLAMPALAPVLCRPDQPEAVDSAAAEFAFVWPADFASAASEPEQAVRVRPAAAQGEPEEPGVAA
ncbi:hypothetical protein Scani_27200 [Streptomyces caniferus]|uniref:Uncharacterized protein n=1 Tax=Streptomyces caniferus TaxID=285557 RepID=A0A640S766_9ACTN|nr:hypothetical protein Scani_27200 [Streptomyces caniferus]